MRKVIGIGETVLDVILQNSQPVSAVPGGSIFNTIVSLKRMDIDAIFISEICNDHVGSILTDYMQRNNISTNYIKMISDGKSPISMAFLNEDGDAEYSFYKNNSEQDLDIEFPEIKEDDIVVIGSYYALNPIIRDRIIDLLNEARDKKAIVYYDQNFRLSHKDEAIKLAASIIENLEYADIVRGAIDDFKYMYNIEDVNKIYKDKIQFYCQRFICTTQKKCISLRTKKISKEYPLIPTNSVCSISSGDNFNAGIIYGLIKNDVHYTDLDDMKESTWDHIIQCANDFAEESCKSYNNVISTDFAQHYKG